MHRAADVRRRRGVIASVNRFEHRLADVEGVRIHFVHRRSAGVGVPLILTHGWPSTFAEMLPLVDRLGDTFDLVIPSLPG